MIQKAKQLATSWQWNWLQYPMFAALALFDMYYIQEPALWARILIGIALLSSPFIPYIRRFTVPAMVIFTWLITFYAVKFFPNNIKPNTSSLIYFLPLNESFTALIFPKSFRNIPTQF